MGVGGHPRGCQRCGLSKACPSPELPRGLKNPLPARGAPKTGNSGGLSVHFPSSPSERPVWGCVWGGVLSVSRAGKLRPERSMTSCSLTTQRTKARTPLLRSPTSHFAPPHAVRMATRPLLVLGALRKPAGGPGEGATELRDGWWGQSGAIKRCRKSQGFLSNEGRWARASVRAPVARGAPPTSSSVWTCCSNASTPARLSSADPPSLPPQSTRLRLRTTRGPRSAQQEEEGDRRHRPVRGAAGPPARLLTVADPTLCASEPRPPVRNDPRASGVSRQSPSCAHDKGE